MRHDQLPFISWRGLKSETTIERLGFGIDGVRRQCADARLFGDRKGATDGILQHAETWTLPLVVEIDGKPRKITSGIGYCPIPQRIRSGASSVSIGRPSD
jgi:hypothetical protein